MVIKRSALQKGAQFNMLIVDRDHGGDIDDLIDHFSIPINISADSLLTGNFIGVYNYTQLELTIEVTCTAQNNTVNNITSCPSSCDIILRFCQLSSDLSQFNLADRLLGTKCPLTPLSSHFDDFLGFDLTAGETYSNSNRESLLGGVVFDSHVVYNGTGRWVNLIAID